jgi:hypothetical protein
MDVNFTHLHHIGRRVPDLVPQPIGGPFSIWLQVSDPCCNFTAIQNFQSIPKVSCGWSPRRYETTAIHVG